MGHSHFQKIEGFLRNILFNLFVLLTFVLLKFRTHKKMVIDTNKYHNFSAKIRYATLVYLSTNCIRSYNYLTSFLNSIPGKKFIEFGQNPAPVPSKLTEIQKLLHLNNRGRPVVEMFELHATLSVLFLCHLKMIIEKMWSFTNFCFLSNQFWHNILNVSWYNTYFKTVKYYVNISFTYYSKVAR